MKQNAEKMPVELSDEDSGQSVETPHQGNGANTISLPSACQARLSRPEITVLGWNVRSYRLSLRESKA